MLHAGFGRADITVYEPGLVMLGWAEPTNTSDSVGDDLACRAVALREGTETLVFACAELAFITGALRDRVLEHLDLDALGLCARSVMVTATHNHSGPSGYSHHFLYNLLEQGFRQEVLDGLASGIAESIRRAVDSLEPALVDVRTGDIPTGVAWNRAWRAYNRNEDVAPVTEQTAGRAVDRTLTLLRVTSAAGRPLGAVSWLGLHGTTVHADHQALRHDHKGAASRQWEEAPPEGAEDFVAIFAQGPAGDVTANFRWDATRKRSVRRDDDLRGRAEVAEAQVATARRLWSAAEPLLTIESGLSSALRHIALEDREVDPAFSRGLTARTTEAVIGLAMALGTDEGPGPYHRTSWLAASLRRLLLARRGDSADGHWPKVTFLEVGRGARGRMLGLIPVRALAPFGFIDSTVGFARDALARGLGDAPWAPTILPLQIFRIGPLAIAGLPCEPTTIAGRRMAATLQQSLEVPHAVIAAYANDYAGYCVTAEEFDEQRYEGGCTWFGRWTCAAWRTELTRLSDDLGTRVVRPSPDRLRPAPHEVEALRFRSRQTGRSLGLFSRRAG